MKVPKIFENSLNIPRSIHTLSAHIVLFIGAINLFFGILIIINALRIEFVFGYITKTIRIIIFSPSLDFGFWAISLSIILLMPLIVRFLRHCQIHRLMIFTNIIIPTSFIIFTANYFQQGLILLTVSGFFALCIMILHSNELLFMAPKRSLMAVIIGILIILISLQLGSLIVMILYPLFDPIFFATSAFRSLPKIHVHLFNTIYPIMLPLLVALMSFWIWIPILNHIISARKLASVKKRLNLQHLFKSKEQANMIRNRRLNSLKVNLGLQRILPVVIILFSVALGFFIVRYTHSFGKELVGVDAYWYTNALDGITGLEDIRETLIRQPRWPYVLLLYLIKGLTSQSTVTVVKHGAVLLISFLSITIFWLVKIGKDNYYLASLSSILTVFSIHTTVGLFAGIYSNWLAISEMVIFFVLLLKAIQKRSKKFVFLATVTSFLVLLTHPWTWGILMSIITCYTVVTFIIIRFNSIKSSLNRIELSYPSAIILSNLILISIVLLQISQIPLISGIKNEIFLGHTSIETLDLMNFLNLGKSLSFTLAYFVGGVLVAPPLFLIAVLGIWASRMYRDCFNRLLLCWTCVPLAISFLTISYWQWRLLYFVPFQILVSIGVFAVIEEIHQLFSTHVHHNIIQFFQALLILSIVLIASNYTFASIVSFVGNLLIFH